VEALASPDSVAAFSAETSVSGVETVVPEGVSPDAPSAQAGGEPDAEANAVAILLVDPKGQILLLHRAPDQVFMGGAWDLPGGKVRSGASARSQALQILAEETGIRLPAKSLSVLLSAYHPTSGTTVFFVANVPESNTVSVNAPEHVAYRWVNADEGRSDMLLVPYMPLVFATLRKSKAARRGYGFAEEGKGTGYGIAALLLAATAAYFVGQQHGRGTR
jgi:8-oxo-dGTP pyrophosphatase MutT (NUDIX family)